VGGLNSMKSTRNVSLSVDVFKHDDWIDVVKMRSEIRDTTFVEPFGRAFVDESYLIE
jgi:hypothetical protein